LIEATPARFNLLGGGARKAANRGHDGSGGRTSARTRSAVYLPRCRCSGIAPDPRRRVAGEGRARPVGRTSACSAANLSSRAGLTEIKSPPEKRVGLCQNRTADRRDGQRFERSPGRYLAGVSGLPWRDCSADLKTSKPTSWETGASFCGADSAMPAGGAGNGVGCCCAPGAALSEQTCVNQGICRGCGAFEDCGLPQAISAKEVFQKLSGSRRESPQTSPERNQSRLTSAATLRSEGDTT
jgi:hypothetical protein